MPREISEAKEKEDRSTKLATTLFAKLLLSSFCWFSLCRWPRTKRNVVEAKELVKDVGRAVLGLPKEPQPQKKN